MDRNYRREVLKRLPDKVKERCTLPDLEREYSLYEIAIITRAGPARMLGLTAQGASGSRSRRRHHHLHARCRQKGDVRDAAFRHQGGRDHRGAGRNPPDARRGRPCTSAPRSTKTCWRTFANGSIATARCNLRITRWGMSALHKEGGRWRADDMAFELSTSFNLIAVVLHRATILQALAIRRPPSPISSGNPGRGQPIGPWPH